MQLEPISSKMASTLAKMKALASSTVPISKRNERIFNDKCLYTETNPINDQQLTTCLEYLIRQASDLITNEIQELLLTFELAISSDDFSRLTELSQATEDFLLKCIEKGLTHQDEDLEEELHSCGLKISDLHVKTVPGNENIGTAEDIGLNYYIAEIRTAIQNLRRLDNPDDLDYQEIKAQLERCLTKLKEIFQLLTLDLDERYEINPIFLQGIKYVASYVWIYDIRISRIIMGKFINGEDRVGFKITEPSALILEEENYEKHLSSSFNDDNSLISDWSSLTQEEEDHKKNRLIRLQKTKAAAILKMPTYLFTDEQKEKDKNIATQAEGQFIIGQGYYKKPDDDVEKNALCISFNSCPSVEIVKTNHLPSQERERLIQRSEEQFRKRIEEDEADVKPLHERTRLQLTEKYFFEIFAPYATDSQTLVTHIVNGSTRSDPYPWININNNNDVFISYDKTTDDASAALSMRRKLFITRTISVVVKYSEKRTRSRNDPPLHRGASYFGRS